MLRYIVREIYLGHVIHANGKPEVTLKSFDGDQEALESFLRYKDCQNEKRPDYTTRELLGLELL